GRPLRCLRAADGPDHPGVPPRTTAGGCDRRRRGRRGSEMDLELTDKVVLVTGGSDGLGRALCRTLVEEGARVAVFARDAERLEESTGELVAMGGQAQA